MCLSKGHMCLEASALILSANSSQAVRSGFSEGVTRRYIQEYGCRCIQEFQQRGDKEMHLCTWELCVRKAEKISVLNLLRPKKWKHVHLAWQESNIATWRVFSNGGFTRNLASYPATQCTLMETVNTQWFSKSLGLGSFCKLAALLCTLGSVVYI